MKSLPVPAALLLTTLLIPIASLGAEATFGTKPEVRKNGDGWEIRFSVSKATNVAVAVLDAKGKVLRHLAAGVLGDNPPPPLKKGLAQALTWSGKDDLGRPAPAGCNVRVRLGSKAVLGKVLEELEHNNARTTQGISTATERADRPAAGVQA